MISVCNLQLSWHRIPHEVHQRLATDFSTRMNASSRKRLQVSNLDHKTSAMLDNECSMPVPDVDLYLYCSPDTQSSGETSTSVNISAERVWNVVAKNASYDDVRSGRGDGRVEKCEYWGIWLLPSFINHSCYPNCNRLRIADAMIVVAARDIPVGEELFLPYFDIFMPLQLREASAKLWGFRCECERCTFERSVGEDFKDIANQMLSFRRQLLTIWIDKTIPHTEAYEVLEQLGKLVSCTESAIENLHADRKQKCYQKLKTTILKYSTLQDVMRGDASHISEIARALLELNLHGRKADVPQDLYTKQFLEKLGFDKNHNRLQKHWIMGSFIDASLAYYALSCKPEPRNILEDGIDLRLYQERNTAKLNIEALKLMDLLTTINNVHPGDMFRQFPR